MFRDEAVEAGRPRWLGDVLLVQPLPVKVAAIFSAVAAGAVVTLLIFGSYTNRVSVAGRLVPAAGVAKIYAAQQGVVVSRQVSEGQQVRRGDVLYVISSERQQRIGAGVHASVTAQIAVRVASLKADIEDMEHVHLQVRQAQAASIDGRREEIGKLDALIVNQQHRVALARANQSRYARLLAQSYVSDERAQEKQSEYLEQSARLSTLQRDRVVAARVLSVEQKKFASLPLSQRREMTARLRELANVEQEFAENEGKREFSVVSPIHGVATAVVADAGQNVVTTTPVATILPVQAPLEAHLYVQSHAIGFIKAGNHVRLRYRAFAYQKFGHFAGTVISVSESTLAHTDLADVDLSDGRYGARVPVYLVKVRIDDAASGEGGVLPLRAGMLLDADIMRETRRLYEWALHPLKSLGESI